MPYIEDDELLHEEEGILKPEPPTESLSPRLSAMKLKGFTDEQVLINHKHDS